MPAWHYRSKRRKDLFHSVLARFRFRRVARRILCRNLPQTLPYKTNSFASSGHLPALPLPAEVRCRAVARRSAHAGSSRLAIRARSPTWLRPPPSFSIADTHKIWIEFQLTRLRSSDRPSSPIDRGRAQRGSTLCTAPRYRSYEGRRPRGESRQPTCQKGRLSGQWNWRRRWRIYDRTVLWSSWSPVAISSWS